MKTLVLIAGLAFAASLVQGADDPAVEAASKAAQALAARDYAMAEAASRRAVEAKPDFAEAWVGLGVALVRQRKEQEARNAFEHALQLHRVRSAEDPHDSNHLLQQMFVLALLHRDAEATALLRIGREKFPDQAGFQIADTLVADFRKMLEEENATQPSAGPHAS